MEVKVNAIVTRSVDYKDNDKILTLFSLEKGKITATIKGVKKPKAKLKFASEPFCFAEYILAEKNGRYTGIGASYIDSFYNLRLNLLKYYLSACVTDTINNLAVDNEENEFLFSLAIKTIENICYGKNEKVSLAYYLYTIANNLGYAFNDSPCSSCGAVISGRVFFNYQDADFSCEDCATSNYSEITLDTYNAFNIVKDAKIEELENLSVDDIKVTKLIKFLLHYLMVKTDVKLKSATSLNEFFAL